MTQRRPNVLFVITDQQRADHVGFAGNETVRTPHLDALAARGTVFDNAWVANPVCMPNRSSIMTGRMPTAHGVIFNDRSLDWGANTHVRTFRNAGWRTGLIGKSHLQHGMSRNAVVPVDKAGAVRDPWPTGWNELEHYENFAETIPEWPDDFYGFEHVELAIDHGSRITGHHLHWALAKGATYEDLVVPMTAEAPATKRSDRWWQIYQPTYGPEIHSTAFVTERTVAFIEDSAAAAQPWVAWASFPDPHHPFAAPGAWYDRHDPADMAVPRTLHDPLEGAAEYLRRIQARTPDTQRGWVGMCGTRDAELVQECIAVTYGMIEMIDDGVGQILAAIDRLGQTDDTIVVFTSDHGDMMGDHGLLLKGYMHFRGTLQPPLVIVDPTRSPQRTSSLVSSLDLGPTLLDLAGLASYDGIQGRSVVPILDDPSASVRDAVLIEDDMPTLLAGFAGVPAKTRTVVDSEGSKYTRHSTGEDMLFDLVADPDEVQPLSKRDSARRAAMVERLADALIATADEGRGAPVTV